MAIQSEKILKMNLLIFLRIMTNLCQGKYVVFILKLEFNDIYFKSNTKKIKTPIVLIVGIIMLQNLSVCKQISRCSCYSC